MLRAWRTVLKVAKKSKADKAIRRLRVPWSRVRRVMMKSLPQGMAGSLI
jgi:hypothetical protein